MFLAFLNRYPQNVQRFPIVCQIRCQLPFLAYRVQHRLVDLAQLVERTARPEFRDGQPKRVLHERQELGDLSPMRRRLGAITGGLLVGGDGGGGDDGVLTVPIGQRSRPVHRVHHADPVYPYVQHARCPERLVDGQFRRPDHSWVGKRIFAVQTVVERRRCPKVRSEVFTEIV